MNHRRACIALLLSGCATAAAQGGPRPTTAAGPWLLERGAGPTGASYERVQTVFVGDTGGGHAVWLEARSHVHVAADPLSPPGRAGGGWTVTQDHGPLVHRRDGAVAPLSGSMAGLERLTMRSRVDTRNQLLDVPSPEDPEGQNPRVVIAIAGALRALRVVYPEHPVAIGQAWDGPVVELDARPHIPLVVTVRPRFELRGVHELEDGRQVATIAWDGRLDSEPFRAMGIEVECHGHLLGTTQVFLDDGFEGRTELDVALDLGPAGASDMLPVLRIQAKYRDERTSL